MAEELVALVAEDSPACQAAVSSCEPARVLKALSRSSGAGLPCATCRCTNRGLTGMALVPVCCACRTRWSSQRPSWWLQCRRAHVAGNRGDGPVQSECTCLAQNSGMPQACNHNQSSLLRLTLPACGCALQEARRHEQAATAAQAALAEGAPFGASQCGVNWYRLPLLPVGCRWSNLESSAAHCSVALPSLSQRTPRRWPPSAGSTTRWSTRWCAPSAAAASSERPSWAAPPCYGVQRLASHSW